LRIWPYVHRDARTSSAFSTVLAVRSYVAALAWVAVGCALYGWQILSLAVR
jgi:hypothetical protein